MRKLSLYHCIVLGVLVLWASMFLLSFFTVRHIQTVQNRGLDSLRSYADIAARGIDFEEGLVKVQTIVLQEINDTGDKESREDLRPTLQALQRLTNELELLSGSVGMLATRSARSESFAKTARALLNKLEDLYFEKASSRSSKPSTAWKNQTQAALAGLFQVNQDLSFHCRIQIQNLQRWSIEDATHWWKLFYVMSLGTLLLGLLLGILIARRFANPVYGLARQINESVEPQRRVELRATHPIDSLRLAVKALVEELQILRGEVNDSRERVSQSERLAVTGRVAVGLTQEIQKPLTAVDGVLRSSAQASPLSPQEVQRALRELERVEAFLAQFLDFTGAQKPRFLVLEVNNVVLKALQFLSAECQQRKVAVETEYGNFPNILGDATLLQEALVNVIFNSLEAMSNGGTISVTTRLSLAGGPPPFSDTGGVEIFIADTGPGFPPESLERVFEPFFSTKTKGTGMGLAIVKRVIEQHGGRVRVLNREGGGAIVSIFLPLPSQEQRETLEKLELALSPKPQPVSAAAASEAPGERERTPGEELERPETTDRR